MMILGGYLNIGRVTSLYGTRCIYVLLVSTAFGGDPEVDLLSNYKRQCKN